MNPKKYLEVSIYEVTWVLDVMSAFRVAKIQRIDVILLDCILPDMDGGWVCSWLKQDDASKCIPIIMLTAMDSTERKVRGLEVGVDDYHAKPYNDIERSLSC